MPTSAESTLQGDADVAAIGAALADRRRAAVLDALMDGRALPASVLASEAGVAPSTVSGHLARLMDAGLVTVEPQGRYRYYRLAGPEVAGMLEAIARVAPPVPVRSLREDSRAYALRRARMCYDHLAGRLGVALMAALVEQGVLSGSDGLHVRGGADRLAAPGRDMHYELTDDGRARLADFGVDPRAGRTRRPVVRYCVDWSEQRHHLGGALGAAVAARLLELGWLRRDRVGRAVQVTDDGRRGLREVFGVEAG